MLQHECFVGGPEVEEFEASFAAYCDATYVRGRGNGTDALELILAGLGIGPGDEVIVPANTFIATAEAVCAVGARPRFVDVLPDTLLIDPDAVAAAVVPATAPSSRCTSSVRWPTSTPCCPWLYGTDWP